MKNKIYGTLAITAFLSCGIIFLNCGVTDTGEPPVVIDDLPLLEQKIIDNGERLVEIRDGRFSSNQGINNLFYFISNGKLVPGTTRRDLLSGLYGIGRTSESRLINEPLVIELFVYALADDERDVRRTASDLLMQRTEWRLLPSFKDEILQSIAVHGYTYDSSRLLVLLNPTESEKQEWLNLPYLSLVTRAALGDTQNEDSLIRTFEARMGTAGFIHVANDLAVVGFNSQRSRIALIKGLDTDHFTIGVYRLTYAAYSDIAEVATALHRLYPDEPLFRREINEFTEWPRIINDPLLIDYFTRLAIWAEQNYGITLNLPKEYSFIFAIYEDLPEHMR